MERWRAHRGAALWARRVWRSPGLLALAFIAPALLLRMFTAVYPFLATAYLSFTDASALQPRASFVGLENYVLLTTDVVLHQSIVFTGLFVAGSTALELVFGFLVALLLNASFRLRQVARTSNLIPWVIPAIVTALGFRFMFDTQFGIIPDLLGRVGIQVNWLTEPGPARVATIVANVWRSTPFVALIILAGLQGIPAELYEAARVDGAGRLRVLWQVVIPLVMPLLVTMGIFLLVWQLGAFDIILGMTGGGPGTSTTVLSYLVYQQAFIGLSFGYASAIAMVLFVFVLLVGGLALALFRRMEVSL